MAKCALCVWNCDCRVKNDSIFLQRLQYSLTITMSGKGADTNLHAGEVDPTLVANATANRMAAQFFEKYDRFEVQEMLAQTSYHWFLSQDEHKLQAEPPDGIIMSSKPFLNNNCLILMPFDPTVEPIDFRLIHQILRELVMGIYGLNQVPSITLEANFDQSTSCQLPPAYNDTYVGQLLTNVDYMMKALWHGAYFPRDKRTKFSERWRSSLDVNAEGVPESKKIVLTEFTLAGMIDVTKDPDYATIYDNMRLFPMSKHDANIDKRLFMQYVNNMSVQLTWRQKTIQQHNNLFVIDAAYEVSGVLRLHEDRTDRDIYERLQTRLQAHVDVIEKHLCNKAEVRRQMSLLRVISFLVPFLMGLRRKNKVPDMSRLLPQLTADECKTERELPPLMLSPEFRCPNFDFGNKYFHLHGGIQIDIEGDDVVLDPPEVILNHYNKIQLEATERLAKLTEPDTFQESYPMVVIELGGKKYYAFSMDLETYYPVSPPRPLWCHSFYEKIKDLKPKRLPLTDIHMHEQFKRRYGYHQAIKFKSLQAGLRQAAIRGLVSVFQTLARKCPASRLGNQDEDGYSLVHYAALHNRAQILQLLMIQGQDISVRRHHLTTQVGTTPLHLAAKSGSLDAALLMVSNHGDMVSADNAGWAAIHHASFYNHAPIVRMFIRKFEDQMELETWDKLRQTPLLLAASSGALESVKILIELGAKILKTDMEKNNMVHLAALRFHTYVLEFFIEWNHKDAPVWKTLVEMLNSTDFRKKDSAVRSLEVLTTSGKHHWKAILEANGIPALVKILQMKSPEMQSLGAAVLCNMSCNEPICHAIAKAGGIPTLIKLLASNRDDIQSRTAIIVADMGAYDDHQTEFSREGGIPPLIHLLDSELEDVLKQAVNAVRVLCLDHHENQTLVSKHGGIAPLVEFLTVNSDELKEASAAALAALTYGHHDNQNAVIAEGAVEPLVKLIKCHNIKVQVKAAAALESLGESNPDSQRAILDLHAPGALIKLLTFWALDVKEQAACSLWALAGSTRRQQKEIAQYIGISGIIDLIVKSERLQYVACKAMIALTRESFDNQNEIKKENGILPLVRILRSSKTIERVLMTVIKALGTLCIGVANRNNPVTQNKIAEEGAIGTLVGILRSSSNPHIKVEIAVTLGAIILGNRSNQKLLEEEPMFSIHLLLQLMNEKDESVRLKAGTALSTFAFNNTSQQYNIREAGGIRMSNFQRFLESEDDSHQAHAAFQIVVLARVIVDRDQVSLSAEGVTRLVGLLKSENQNTVILAGSLLASLAHTRAGIPDAMITSGAVDILIYHLNSDNIEVRSSSAVALGYLTFNRTATRLLLIATRNTPGLFQKLMDNLDKDGKISEDFTEEFRRQQVVGLPALSLEKHGGPLAVPPPRPRGSSRQQSRPNTTMGFNSRPTTAASSKSGKPPPRSTSAPVRSRQVRTPKVITPKAIAQGNGRRVKIEEGNLTPAKSTNTKVAWD
ncbi:ankyrin and armadillo repeat-containing protein-like isoform X3 [Lytechinus pictus]|uniref:ankyrin and armadillo repeat-containing protein-like isoform X3 n=2 Tax=Lytechinus pictus TaxID=7653 RepID=UPI0030B9D7BF